MYKAKKNIRACSFCVVLKTRRNSSESTLRNVGKLPASESTTSLGTKSTSDSSSESSAGRSASSFIFSFSFIFYFFREMRDFFMFGKKRKPVHACFCVIETNFVQTNEHKKIRFAIVGISASFSEQSFHKCRIVSKILVAARYILRSFKCKFRNRICISLF